MQIIYVYVSTMGSVFRGFSIDILAFVKPRKKMIELATTRSSVTSNPKKNKSEETDTIILITCGAESVLRSFIMMINGPVLRSDWNGLIFIWIVVRNIVQLPKTDGTTKALYTSI